MDSSKLNYFIKKYDGIYDFSKAVYVNNITKVSIICPKHGEFKCTPNELVRGHICPACRGGFNELKTVNFIKDAKAKYGDKYSYDKTVYNTYNDKVIITCQQHGDFSMLPTRFLDGYECPACRRAMQKEQRDLITQENINYETETFIAKAKAKFGNKYSYEKTAYKNIHTKLIIGCPVHGDVNTWANVFMKIGCCKCQKDAEIRSRLERNFNRN